MSKISPLGTSVYHIFNQPKTIIMLSNPSENPDHGKRIPSSSLNPTGGNAKLISIQPFPLLSTSISTVHPPTKVGCCGKRNPLNFSLYDEPLEKTKTVSLSTYLILSTDAAGDRRQMLRFPSNPHIRST